MVFIDDIDSLVPSWLRILPNGNKFPVVEPENPLITGTGPKSPLTIKAKGIHTSRQAAIPEAELRELALLPAVQTVIFRGQPNGAGRILDQRPNQRRFGTRAHCERCEGALAQAGQSSVLDPHPQAALEILVERSDPARRQAVPLCKQQQSSVKPRPDEAGFGRGKPKISLLVGHSWTRFVSACARLKQHIRLPVLALSQP